MPIASARAKTEREKNMAIRSQQTAVQITPPNMETAIFRIEGTAPYVMEPFSAKAKQAMRSKQEKGTQAQKQRAKQARDFDEDYEQAFHRSEEGWVGVPASAFRTAMISACRLVGFTMTMAKLCVFIEADGLDIVEGKPLVRIHGEPERTEMVTRNATGVADIRVRPMWRHWKISLRVRFDADQFTVQDVTNLLMRVGEQVGIGAGRPDSKKSAGLGWGTFQIVND
jgi:hypothetical protein